MPRLGDLDTACDKLIKARGISLSKQADYTRANLTMLSMLKWLANGEETLYEDCLSPNFCAAKMVALLC